MTDVKAPPMPDVEPFKPRERHDESRPHSVYPNSLWVGTSGNYKLSGVPVRVLGLTRSWGIDLVAREDSYKSALPDGLTFTDGRDVFFGTLDNFTTFFGPVDMKAPGLAWGAAHEQARTTWAALAAERATLARYASADKPEKLATFAERADSALTNYNEKALRLRCWAAHAAVLGFKRQRLVEGLPTDRIVEDES